MQTHRIKTGMIMILGWAMGSHLGFATSTADLPTELDKLDTLRNGKDTQYDVVESTGERLLQEYPKDDDRRQIYAELADIYEQCGVAHPERITKYATAAISLSADSLEIGHLYVDLGDAVQVQFSQTDGQAFLAARKLAAREYLKGLSAIEKVNAPEKIDPSPPSVPRLDISGPMTPEHEKLFDERDRLIKERETYMTNRRAIEVRTTLRNQIAYIYTRRPYFTAEIRELAAGSLRDPADLEGLMNQVSDAVQKRKAAVGGVELEMPPLPPEFSTVPASQATNSTKAPDAKGSPATSEPAAESR